VNSKRAEWRNRKHGDQWISTLTHYAFPLIGDKKLSEIETDDILAILEPIWGSKTETASRLRGRLEWILAAAATRKLRAGMNPAGWRDLFLREPLLHVRFPFPLRTLPTSAWH